MRQGTVQDELNRQALVEIGKRLSTLEGKFDKIEDSVFEILNASFRVEEAVERLRLLVSQLVRASAQDEDP